MRRDGMTARPAIDECDVFGLLPITDIPDDVARGLKTLADSAPLWPVDVHKWRATVGAVQAFSAAFDARARAHDWTTTGLYGLSRLAPWADVSRLGAAWIVARSRHRVAGIDRDGIC
jgi:hypothetical protein